MLQTCIAFARLPKRHDGELQVASSPILVSWDLRRWCEVCSICARVGGSVGLTVRWFEALAEVWTPRRDSAQLVKERVLVRVD